MVGGWKSSRFDARFFYLGTDLFSHAGWTAQVLEQLRDSRLYRPLTLYTGPKELMPVPPIEAR